MAKAVLAILGLLFSTTYGLAIGAPSAGSNIERPMNGFLERFFQNRFGKDDIIPERPDVEHDDWSPSEEDWWWLSDESESVSEAQSEETPSSDDNTVEDNDDSVTTTDYSDNRHDNADSEDEDVSGYSSEDPEEYDYSDEDDCSCEWWYWWCSEEEDSEDDVWYELGWFLDLINYERYERSTSRKFLPPRAAE